MLIIFLICFLSAAFVCAIVLFIYALWEYYETYGRYKK
jgi:hypothetical protein